MKLLTTKRSPYARKVRIVALEKNIPLELIAEDLAQKSLTLLSANPVGKIPTLILDNGTTLCDSPVICEYLDGLTNTPILIPKKDPAQYFKIINLAAIADGLMDVTVARYMETVRHPKDLNEDFIKKQDTLITSCLKFFNEHVKDLHPLTIAAIAAASALGYLNFRLAQLASPEKYPSLRAWFLKFSKRPSLSQTMPTA